MSDEMPVPVAMNKTDVAVEQADPDVAYLVDTKHIQPPMAVNPMQMLSMAVQSGSDVEVLERLVALAERWKASEAATAFSMALSAMRANLPILFKNKEVNFNKTQYKY